MNRRIVALAGLGLVGTAIAAASLATTESWSDADMDTVRGLSVDALPPLPADPSNRVADDLAAAALGEQLFFDTRLSANGDVACASCHLPDRGYQDDLPLGRGVGTTGRRTMPIPGMAYAPFLFWDGRRDSLWSQALGPLESEVEHATDRTSVAHLVAEHYRAEYELVFGQMPDLTGIAAPAGPVADAEAAWRWNEMEPEDQNSVSEVFANVGKAIAAYERTIPVSRTRFDDWVSDPSFPRPGILSEDEIAGLRLFVGEAECINCHNGPLFTDNHFHNTGVPSVTGAAPDVGREGGARQVLSDPFNCLGNFSDASPDDCSELRFMALPSRDALGAFKTPSLRGVSDRPPYMHAGQLASIAEVIDHYADAPAAAIGHSELRPHELTDRERSEIEAFLLTLLPSESQP
ncbi:hypothetical protein HKCCE3408_08405 [Rhodobacterales bacterium HKCCE3408]|nr:hypothetical protein [Rhodobacterales bacterium HKCCE3408]